MWTWPTSHGSNERSWGRDDWVAHLLRRWGNRRSKRVAITKRSAGSRSNPSSTPVRHVCEDAWAWRRGQIIGSPMSNRAWATRPRPLRWFSPGGRTCVARDFSPWNSGPSFSSSPRGRTERSVRPRGGFSKIKETYNQGLKPLATSVRPPGGIRIQRRIRPKCHALCATASLPCAYRRCTRRSV